MLKNIKIIDNIMRETSINEIAHVEINYINDEKKEAVENITIKTS